jgi:hypothetical protein
MIEQPQEGQPATKRAVAFYGLPLADGSYGTLTTSGVTGPCVVTVDTSVKPTISATVVGVVTVAGTVGTGSGPTIKWSVDNGATFGTPASLGTATSYTVVAANAKFNFTSAGLATNDTFSVVTIAPSGTPASYDAIDTSGKSGTGTSVASVDSTVKPYGTYDAQIRVNNDSTVGSGTAPLIQWSLDGGITWSRQTTMGTNLYYTIADGNVKFAFTAGTLKAGDVIKVHTNAPKPLVADVQAAFAALARGSAQFGVLVCDFETDATMFAALSAGWTALDATGKTCVILTRARNPNTGEGESTWGTSISAAFVGSSNSKISLVAAYGLITDAMTSRQYLRSLLTQFAADTIRVDLADWPDAPADRKMANVKIVNAAGVDVGHDEGPRGVFTGLSDETQGNRFWCVQRLPDVARVEDVFSTVPWTMFAAGDTIQNLMTARVVNLARRVSKSAAVTQLGGRLAYNAASGSNPATLTDRARRAAQSVIYGALAPVMKPYIQNAGDAALDTGLVQVSPTVTVTGGNLLHLTITLSLKVYGYVLAETFNVAVIQ